MNNLLKRIKNQIDYTFMASVFVISLPFKRIKEMLVLLKDN
jgi:hypothetical protein